MAGLFQEIFSSEIVLHRNPWQQKSAADPMLDKQTVLPNLNLVGLNLLQG